MHYKSRYFELLEDSAGDEYIISGDEVLVVPLTDDGRVIFIREPAPAFGRHQPLLLPGGTVEEGEDLAETANRELQEEIGYRAERMEPLVELRPWSKYLRVTSHAFLARGLQPSKLDGDEPYVIALEPRPLAELDTLIASGALHDARVISALLLARQRLAADT
jgi:ADP-ribose diphosphatase